MTVDWQKPVVAQAQMRASNADRERTADVLRAGFAEGRLTKEEYDERVDVALRAGTYGELDWLVSDLPHGPNPAAAVPAVYAPAPVMVLPPPQLAPVNGTATAAMVCGIGTLFTGGLSSIPAVVLGHKARRDIRRTGERGDGRATTGLVMGYIAIALWLMAGLGSFTFSSSSSGEDERTETVIVEDGAGDPGPEGAGASAEDGTDTTP
jgi:hypothetical protein